MMKFYGYLICFICILASQAIAAGDEHNVISSVNKSCETDYKKDEILVKYKPSRSPMSEKTAKTRSGFSEIKSYNKTGITHLKITADMDVEQALELYRSDPDIEYAEPNYRYHIARTPNDPHYSKQWALHNTGQNVNNENGLMDADIDAPEAWDITTGDHDVIVAVIDSGVDYNHPDLSPNIWINKGEVAGNGIDDDGNGRVDDIRGWDFVDSDNDPMDYNDHGTHVAGTIAAVGNNGMGVAGVAWSAKIMALRGFDTEGYGDTSDLIEAINYATEKGADVINVSWGGGDYSQALKDTIEASSAIVVCAAGNDSKNIDKKPHYPSGYDSPNIISVAATDQRDNLAYFSSYGPDSVDIGAPGTNIYSTSPARQIIWSDNFDDGNINGWTTGGTNNSWGVTTSRYSSPLYALAVSVGSNYKSNTNSWIKSSPVNLTGHKGARLDFKINGVSESDYDFLKVQTSSNGTSWIDHEIIDGTSGGEWVEYTVDMNVHEGKSTVYIRFLFASDELNNYEGFFIDDISVSAFSTSFSGKEYRFMDGTSMAASYVSGAAAIIKTLKPEGDAEQIKSLILDAVDLKTSLKVKVLSSGRLNIQNAVKIASNTCHKININLQESVKKSERIFQGEVSISFSVGEDVTILISSSDTNRIITTPSVIIPAGQISAFFDVTIIDNPMVHESESVTITARIPGCVPEASTIMVYNDQISEHSVRLEIPGSANKKDGILESQGSISIGDVINEDTIFYLTSADTDKVTVPESVILPAGQVSVNFDITIIDDVTSTGPQHVVITAWAEGWNADSATILILDDENIKWIDKTFSTSLSCILRDDMRDVIYLGDAGAGQLVVIDTISLKVILRLDLDSKFSDMTISKDSSTMAVAGGSLFLVDLETFTKRKLLTDLDAVSVDFDHNGDLMLLTSEPWGYIHHYDPDTEKVIKTFGKGFDINENIPGGGLLRTDRYGNMLYAGMREISPASIYRFDISGDTPLFMAENNFNELGGSLRDFVLSPRYDEIYVACDDPYAIQVLDSNQIGLIQSLKKSESNGVAVDREGYYVFGVNSSTYENIFYQFDITKRKEVFKYNLQKQAYNGSALPKGLAVDRQGKRAFIIHGDTHPASLSAKIQVVELCFRFNISLPNSVVEGAGILKNQGLVTALKKPSESIEVFLEVADNIKSIVQIPDSITIPPGEMSAAFDITILDNTILDGTESVKITARATGYPPASGTIKVHDNETAFLGLDVPSVVMEGDGLLADMGRVTVDRPVEGDVTAKLSADIDGEIVFPRNVIIPKGKTFVEFDLNIIDDIKYEGRQEITITAHVEGCTGDYKAIEIIDNEDIPKLSLSSDHLFSEGDGSVTNAGTLSVSSLFPYDLEINLSSSDPSKIEVPASVIIPAWQTSAAFSITVKDDEEKDGLQIITITADWNKFEDAYMDIVVTDNDNITWINETESSSLTYILRDDARDRIYLADAGNSELVIIDSQELKVVERIELYSRFTDMSISKDDKNMIIAGETLYLLNLDTLDVEQLPVDLDVISADFNHSGDIMLLTSEERDHIYQYNIQSHQIVETFGSPSFTDEVVCDGTLLRTDKEGKILFVLAEGNPSVYVFDISGETPVFLAEDGFNNNSPLDVVFSPHTTEAFMAFYSELKTVNVNNLEVKQTLNTNLFHSITLEPAGDFLYALPSSPYDNKLYQLAADTMEQSYQYNLLSAANNDHPLRRGIAVDRHGKRAFIIHGDDLSRRDAKIQVVELMGSVTAYGKTVAADKNTPVKIILSAYNSQGNPLSYEIVEQTSHGLLELNGSEVIYSPDDGYTGSDMFSFKVNDGLNESNIANVKINVLGSPPVAQSQSLRTMINTPLDITLTGYDPDGNELTFEILSVPENGQIEVDLPHIKYIPYNFIHGEDSLSFIVSDGLFESEPGTVDITILESRPLGDINGDLWSDLKDAILALQLNTNNEIIIDTSSECDINGDGLIGLEEAINALRNASEIEYQ